MIRRGRCGARFALLSAFLLYSGCAAGGEVSAPQRVERLVVSDGWLAMGTFFEADLRVRAENRSSALSWLDWARAEVARLEQIYSRHDPTSELSQLNRALSSVPPDPGATPVGVTLEGILRQAARVWRQSGGAFDPTVGPLVDVWTAAGEQGDWPAQESLEAAQRRVAGGRLLGMKEGRVSASLRGARLDLDGISKGAVLDYLGDRFVDRLPGGAALLSFGESSVLAIGDPEGDPVEGGWRMEARSRDDQGGTLATVLLRDAALSVSSSVGREIQIGAERVSHVLDPRTGQPVKGSIEAIVVSERAALADAWSTALLVLGTELMALERAEQVGIEACVFESGGRRSAATSGWERFEAPVADR